MNEFTKNVGTVDGDTKQQVLTKDNNSMMTEHAAKRTNLDIASVARTSVASHPESHVEMAMSFVEQVCPAYLSQSNECLVRLGRSLENLVKVHHENLSQNLERPMKECQLLSADDHLVKVPKTRFGRTELSMPLVTLGCMRFQMEWGTRIQNMNQVGPDCQDNLTRILRRAFALGINHIETARGYGSSELQLGVALKHLMATGAVARREDFILQTKVRAFPDAKEFRETLETSFRNLQVEYVDLFAFHGLNLPEHYDWVFGEGGCYSVIQEYVKAGKVRHVGFSTHGPPDVIEKFIATNKFDYVNLHYHFCGSYTASGCGNFEGNLGNVRLAAQKDMGVFCISPYDKGGRLYAPSNKLRSLCLPDLEPMEFGSAWLWNHAQLDEQQAPIHTIVCGAARPSDLDLPAVAAHLQGTQPEVMLAKVKSILQRLDKAKRDALGDEWLQTCYKGIPKSNVSHHSVEHTQIVWMYNLIQAFGMLDFAKDRYGSLENNRKKWDASLPKEENIDKLGRVGWGFVPGLSYQPDTDYSDDFVNVPECNREKIHEAEEFVHKWCARKQSDKKAENGNDAAVSPAAPEEWETAYDMRIWPDFPDRPRRQ